MTNKLPNNQDANRARQYALEVAAALIHEAAFDTRRIPKSAPMELYQWAFIELAYRLRTLDIVQPGDA